MNFENVILWICKCIFAAMLGKLSSWYSLRILDSFCVSGQIIHCVTSKATGLRGNCTLQQRSHVIHDKSPFQS